MARALWKGIDLVRTGQHPDRAAHGGARPPAAVPDAAREGQVAGASSSASASATGTPVAWEDLVKGYEYAKGHFVVLTKEDFQAAALEKTRTIDIIDFVKADEIDDRFFETPYYLVPAKGGERAYALLREAIRESGRDRHRQVHPARRAASGRGRSDRATRSCSRVMRFADELVDAAQFELPGGRGRPEAGARYGQGARQQPGRRMGSRRSTPTSTART